MARPSKATEARIAALLAALRVGNTREAAAGHAEIDRTTLYRWLVTDRGLQAQVDKAEADAEVRFAAQVAQAASEDWRAAAWWLERRRPAAYGRAAAAAVAAEPLGPPTTTEPADPHPLDALTAAEQVVCLRELADHLAET